MELLLNCVTSSINLNNRKWLLLTTRFYPHLYPYASFSVESIWLIVLNGKEWFIGLYIFYFTQVRYFEMLIGSAIYITAFATLTTDLKWAVQCYFFTVKCKHNFFVLRRKSTVSCWGEFMIWYGTEGTWPFLCLYTIGIYFGS